MADQLRQVTLGVDTHAQVHVAALLDHLGRLQATRSIPASQDGYQQLLRWAGRHGQLVRAGVEGTGSYGAGLTRRLTQAGVQVIEVDRPNRQRRRRNGKSDPTDAEAAARAVLAGEATTIPKARSGIVEAIRVLRVARSGAIKARTQAANQLRDLLVTAPDELHAQLHPLSTAKRVAHLAAQQPGGGADPASATRRALWHLARRYRALTAELDALDADLATLTAKRPRGCWPATASGWRPPASCWLPPGTTPTGSAPRRRWLRCAAPAPWRRPRARPPGTG
jgi:transposase